MLSFSGSEMAQRPSEEDRDCPKGKGKGGKDQASKKAKVGNQVPDVSLHQGFPPTKMSLKELCKDKKVVLVGLPGAFTST